MADPRPEDLIPLDEAARRVDRSKSTIRTWVRSGELEGYREDPDRPENSRLLVSLSALQALVVIAGKSPNPGRPLTRPGGEEGPSVVALRAEVETLRSGMIEALRSNVIALEGRIADLNRALDAERERGEEWRARAMSAEAEREALRKERGLPWWRRLLGGATEPPPALAEPRDRDETT